MRRVDITKHVSFFITSKPFLRAAVNIIENIKEEDDKEVISVLIEALQENLNSIKKIEKELGFKDTVRVNVKEDIRHGIGDYKDISEKCIKLGLV